MKKRIKSFFLKFHYGWIVGSYILICILIISFAFHNIKKMVSDYNEEQVRMVTGLLVENVNSELDNIVVQVEHVANIVLTNEGTSKEKLRTLKKYSSQSSFESVGFLDDNYEFHGDMAEKTDLVKWGLITKAINADNTFITDPYRSSITGKYVMTIFVPVYEEEERIGILYANLDIGQIATFANNNKIDFPAMICIVNAKSLNYITCTDMNGIKAGSWNNLMLRRDDMVFKYDDGYSNFLKEMDNNAGDGTLCFAIDDKDYTLGYSNIEKMPNWYIAYELDNDELSDTFTKFRSSVYAYVFAIIIITLFYAFYIISKELLQRREFQKLSTLDPMTGIFNKRTFIYLVENYIKSNIEKNSGALIFVDVDDFKKYNDAYGHLNGDIVLKSFANSLSSQFDSIGYVGRYGGDEFVVFVKGSYEKKEISERVAKVRESLSLVELEGFGNVPISFSAGGAYYPADGITYEELCNAADKALYQVKESGKGRFYWS